MFAPLRSANSRWLLAAVALNGCGPGASFVEVGDFGDNPGGLRMFEHAPAGAPQGPLPLVVVLHGCLQDHSFADAGGFVADADERGYLVVAAEQAALNNGDLCFNWFDAADTGRNQGEARSIERMIAAAGRRHDVDTARVFVAGVSGGAAMASALLASYPDVLTAGAIVAGGPAHCADSVVDAAPCMSGDVDLDGEAWADRVRDALSFEHDGPWPRVLVMQGADDPVVDARSADELVEQWAALHEIGAAPSSTDDEELRSTRGAVALERFGEDGGDAGGVVLVERLRLEHIGHAWPIDAGAGCGGDAPFLEDVELCAAALVGRFFLDGDASVP